MSRRVQPQGQVTVGWRLLPRWGGGDPRKSRRRVLHAAARSPELGPSRPASWSKCTSMCRSVMFFAKDQPLPTDESRQGKQPIGDTRP